MKGAILLLLISACLRAQQQGSLEGTAIHAVTREPLSNVHVRLTAETSDRTTAAYGAMSDRTGHFSIATIRPGTYILAPELAGYLFAPAKRTSYRPYLTIKPGEALTGYQLEMTPWAVIPGRVVDEAGDPVRGVTVQSVPVPPGRIPVVWRSPPDPRTDDRGEFRLIVPAGKYYVQATTDVGGGDAERPEIRSDGTSAAIYATTFYPSSIREERGKVVEVAAGKEAGGIEIRLARQQGLSISGVVSGIPEGGLGANIVAEFEVSGQGITDMLRTRSSADGKFRFDRLQPGFYQLRAIFEKGKTLLVSRSIERQMGNLEIANVELVLDASVELSGTLKMEGEGAGAATPKRTVKLDPMEGRLWGLMTGGEVDRDGAFRIANIVPGKYLVRLQGLTENAYVKTLEIDGMAASFGIADLSHVARGASAKVTIGSNGAQISGQVLDANGEPMVSDAVLICLARDAEYIPLYGDGRVQPTLDGKYKVKAVAPGKYRLFAVNELQIRGSGDEDTIIKKMFERGEEIEFKEGDRIVKDLSVIPGEDPNAKPKK